MARADTGKKSAFVTQFFLLRPSFPVTKLGAPPWSSVEPARQRKKKTLFRRVGMTHKKARTVSLAVLLLAGVAELVAPQQARAFAESEACAWSCEDLSTCETQGSTCTLEDCYSNRNIKYPYVIRCAEAQ